MKKSFVKDLATYAPAQFLPAVTAFVTTPILTRLLTPAEYGYWATALGVSALLVALAASGMASAVIRFYSGYETKATVDIFFSSVGMSTGAVVGGLAALGFLALALFRRVLPAWLVHLLPLIILIFVAQSIFTVFMAVIRAQRRSGLYTSFQLATNYGGLGLGLLSLVALGFGVAGLLLGTLLALTLALPFLVFLATRNVGIHPRQFRLPDAIHLWQYAWPLALGSLAMWALRVSDLFVIGLLRPAREVGLYSVSYNISAKSIELLVSLFLLSVSPLVYRTWETEGREATESTLIMVTRLYLLVCLPAAVGLTVLAFPFVALLTAPAYYEGSRIVGFVVFSSFIWGLANIAMMGLTIKRQARRLGANQLAAATVHIGLQFVLVPHVGYTASAISTVVGYTALLLFNERASRAYLTWRFPFSTLRNATVASAAMGLVAWATYRMSGVEGKVSVGHLLLSITAAVLVYAASLLLLGEVDDDERRTVAVVWSRVTGG
ncbi:MAG: hypothetical protein JWL61_2460 [Gemmatimonadetes bacterium]|nr:hypothetical protein [Gemmatimonadota bacterium]